MEYICKTTNLIDNRSARLRLLESKKQRLETEETLSQFYHICFLEQVICLSRFAPTSILKSLDSAIVLDNQGRPNHLIHRIAQKLLAMLRHIVIIFIPDALQLKRSNVIYRNSRRANISLILRHKHLIRSLNRLQKLIDELLRLIFTYNSDDTNCLITRTSIRVSN